MEKERKCGNCANKRFHAFGGYDYCMDYEMAEDTVECAKTCSRYVYEEPEKEYCPSSSAGDYSPSCPWNAPGMSIRDFI